MTSLKSLLSGWRRISLVGLGLLVATALLNTPRPAYATDFGGDQTGQTLTVVDNVFTFLSTITGTFTVQIPLSDSYVILNFSQLTQPVDMNLSSSSNQTVSPGINITFQGFATDHQYWIILTDFDDTLTGSIGLDLIQSQAGNDTADGGAGNDVLFGGGGDDILLGGEGEDILYGNEGNDVLYGGGGGDALVAGAGHDALYGEEGDDALYGEEGNDSLLGQEGNDQLYGGPGSDALDGGVGYDKLNGEVGNDVLYGGAGNDALNGGVDLNEDIIDGGSEIDTVTDDLSSCFYDNVTAVEHNPCVSVPPTPEPPLSPDVARPLNSDLCLTRATRVAYVDDTLVVYSDFTNTPNGMIITQIPLRSLRAPTDEEKLAGSPVWLGYTDSKFAPGWGVGVYWQASHYGFVIYKDQTQTIYDDTGAICGWF